jgi:nicotinate-nucleotide pyrophosphorylase (carboxylating)
MFDLKSKRLTAQIEAWLDEDLGFGDVTSHAVVPADHRSYAIIHAKQGGILAGIQIACRVFEIVDSALELNVLKIDGDQVERGDDLMVVYGCTRSILSGERLALNLLQRLSGIASVTREFVNQLQGLPVRLVDTRKTTPGLRALEKYAVQMGGGYNHRFGLHDAVMIKDNHIKAAGDLQTAVRFARTQIPHTMKIEVEIESLAQIEDALEADIIMLDNMTIDKMTEAVHRIRQEKPHIIIEASGNVNKQTVRAIATTGVDVISAGCLTHSVSALDISLDLNRPKGSNV